MTQQSGNDQVANYEESKTQQHHQQSWVTPGSVLLVSSLPLCIGGYVGYRRALHESTVPETKGVFGGSKGNSILGQIIHPEPPTGTASKKPLQSASANIKSVVPPPILAARALVLGSLLSVGATSLLVSGIFYSSGCRSMDDLMSTWRSWAPKKLHQCESSLGKVLGIDIGLERRSAKYEYEKTTKDMSEEEEIDYAASLISGEIQWDDDKGNKEER